MLCYPERKLEVCVRKGRLFFFSSIGLSLMKSVVEVHIYLNISVYFMYNFIMYFKHIVNCFLIKVMILFETLE